MSEAYYEAYIGTNSVRGSEGIYTLRIDAQTLVPHVTCTMQAYNTGALDLSADGHFLFAACEGMTFRGKADGGVLSFAVGENGALTPAGAAYTHGQRTCCVAADRAQKNLYTCNFYTGTFAAFALDARGGIAPARLVVAPPDIPGAWRALHCVQPIGDDYVGVISLAECALVVYAAADGRRVTSFPFPGRPFCRYFIAHGDLLYAMMQEPGDIYVLHSRLAENGTLELVQKCSVLPADHRGPFATTTLRLTPNGRLLLAAARATNSLSVFAVQQDGTLALRSVVRLPGLAPRDFHISRDGALAVAALQASDAVCALRIDYENETLRAGGGTVHVPSPAAVAVSGRR